MTECSSGGGALFVSVSEASLAIRTVPPPTSGHEGWIRQGVPVQARTVQARSVQARSVQAATRAGDR